MNVEKQNKQLLDENVALKEKLLDLEYKQRRNNLIFEGIYDEQGETDIQCMNKLRLTLVNVPGLDSENVHIDRCYRLDGVFKETPCRILCSFNLSYDVQCILRN